MSSPNTKKFLLKKRPVIVVDIGCSCRPRRHRSKLFSLLTSSFSRSSNHHRRRRRRGDLTAGDYSSSTTKAKKRVVNESVAVVKESTEPYVDFRESMVQMIVEEELYAWDDLNDLLHRFLSLNSPQHHHLILGAFADVWDGVFSQQQGY